MGGGYPKGSAWGGDISGSSAGRDGTTTVNYTNEVKAAKTPIMEAVIVDPSYNKQAKMVPKLQEVYKGLGFTFKPTGLMWGNYVTIIPPGGTEATQQKFDLSEADGKRSMLEFINANMDSKLSQDAIESGNVVSTGKYD